jgi:hypothetical protein
MTLEGLHYSKIWTNVGRAILGRIFDVTSVRAVCEACIPCIDNVKISKIGWPSDLASERTT